MRCGAEYWEEDEECMRGGDGGEVVVGGGAVRGPMGLRYVVCAAAAAICLRMIYTFTIYSRYLVEK